MKINKISLMCLEAELLSEFNIYVLMKANNTVYCYMRGIISLSCVLMARRLLRQMACSDLSWYWSKFVISAVF